MRCLVEKTNRFHAAKSLREVSARDGLSTYPCWRFLIKCVVPLSCCVHLWTGGTGVWSTSCNPSCNQPYLYYGLLSIQSLAARCSDLGCCLPPHRAVWWSNSAALWSWSDSRARGGSQWQRPTLLPCGSPCTYNTHIYLECAYIAASQLHHSCTDHFKQLLYSGTGFLKVEKGISPIILQKLPLFLRPCHQKTFLMNVFVSQNTDS